MFLLIISRSHHSWGVDCPPISSISSPLSISLFTWQCPSYILTFISFLSSDSICDSSPSFCSSALQQQAKERQVERQRQTTERREGWEGNKNSERGHSLCPPIAPDSSSEFRSKRPLVLRTSTAAWTPLLTRPPRKCLLSPFVFVFFHSCLCLSIVRKKGSVNNNVGRRTEK